MLTRRQQEVLVLTSLGHSEREIAATLKISPYTVKEYKRDVRFRLAARTSTEAVGIAFRQGLLR